MRYLFIALLVSSAAQAQPSATPEPAKGDVAVRRNDFAYGAVLEIEREQALQRLVLPEGVYDNLTRADAGDVAVFNNSGSQVPHALRRASESVHETPDVKLPVFPLKATSRDSLDNVAITVERSSNGSVVKVQTKDGENPQPEVLAAYLIDVSTITQPIRSLAFHWKGPESNFVQQLIIAQSDDLQYWSVIEYSATVASLMQQGHRIEKERIEITPTRTKYLRITWPGSPPPRELDTVSAGLAASITEPAREWATATEVTTPRPGVYRFHLKGNRPVDRVRVNLPEDNTLADATLASSTSPEGPWSTRFGGLIYRLDTSGIGVITIPVEDVADAYWQLEVSTQGGGIGNGTPSFDVGWLPHELLFATRGEGPFVLAYGNANRGTPSFDPAALASLGRKEGGEAIGTANIVDLKVELGGVGKLTPEPPDTTLPIRRIVLWASLSAAVLLLGWMSVRLFRQMGT